MQNQSFRTVFVTNSPSLLASGSTVDQLAIGQIGVIDAKTNLAVTAPTYATTKAFQVYWGTPNIDLGIYGGVPNETDRSKLIKGKLIKGFRAKKASKPQTQKIVIGWTGDVSDTETITAGVGERKFLYLNYTGTGIDKLFSKQGITRAYSVDTSCWNSTDDCSTSCGTVDNCRLADEFVKQINADSWTNKFAKARAITECSLSGGVACYVFTVDLCDAGDDASLGLVQAQYPGLVVTRTKRVGATSTYSLTKSTNSLPTAVTNAGMILIPDCSTCPSGYTAVTSKKVYTIKISDAGTVAALTAAATAYGIVSPESITRLSYEYGTSTYVATSSTALTAIDADQVTFLGDSRVGCVITTPTTTAWVLSETLYKYPKTYRLTIGDTVCGSNRLAEIQATFPELVVSIVDARGSCVHTYQTTVYSQCVPLGCSQEQLFFTRPQNFDGVQWEAVASEGGDGTEKAGIEIEIAFINRTTSECTYDRFPADDYDTVFVNASEYNPDTWQGSNCETSWKVREIQGFKPPIGDGARLRKQEEYSKGYDLRVRHSNPVVRENMGYSLQADPNKYYDEYVLEFDFEYKVGGWAQKHSESYHLSIYVPEGTGSAIESLFNTYLQSAAIQIDPVVL